MVNTRKNYKGSDQRVHCEVAVLAHALFQPRVKDDGEVFYKK